MDQIEFLSSLFNVIKGKTIRHGFGAIAASFTFLLFATPVFAHHPMGGKTPSNLFEGFMSGMAHPVIGLDHLAFVVAIGLLAAARPQGFLIPVSFVMAAMMGTGLHLLSIDLPVVELIVSGSILIFGILIVSKDIASTSVISVLAGLAGLFHGFAYGEAIFGAEMTPLVSYLAGFTVIQLLISVSTFAIAKKFLDSSNLKSAGFMIFGVGLAFTSSQVMNLLFPLPK
jgi:urease accessory protein